MPKTLDSRTAQEFTGRVILVDEHTAGDVSYLSKTYPHPEYPQKKVVVTELYEVTPNPEEIRAGLQAHYLVRGELVDKSTHITHQASQQVDRLLALQGIKLPEVTGRLPCKEYTDEYSDFLRSLMIGKEIFK